MNESDKDKLNRERVYLVDHVNPDGLLTHLLAKKTINQRIKEIIEKAGTTFQQVEKLLDYLFRAQPEAYEHFCDALEENNQGYIVTHIEDAAAKRKAKSARVEKLAFRDNNNDVARINFIDSSPTKRCHSMPSMGSTKEETRYALKHFESLPVNASQQSLDQVPTKLNKCDSSDVYTTPDEISCSKRQRLMEDSDIQNVNSGQNLKHEIIVKLTDKRFYYQNCKKAYKMNRTCRGLALIINVNEIAGMKPRKGSDVDASNLQSLMQKLHFNVNLCDDDDQKMTAMNINQVVYEFSQNPEHKFADATVVCLLSHGADGDIFGSDGKRVALNKLYNYFDNVNCPDLMDKPKIFIVQACRGNLVDYGTTVSRMGDLTPPIDEADGPDTFAHSSSRVCAPTKSDMIICYPTQEGYRAWRNRERGSWFIEAIVEVFSEEAWHEDICSLLHMVNKRVSQMVSSCSNEKLNGTVQMSEFQSTLRENHLYFFPGIGCVR